MASPLLMMSELYVNANDLDLTDWERKFVNSLLEQQEKFGDQFTLSEKQVAKLEDIYNEHFDE